MKILTVEDDPITQLLLESALHGLGHEVVACADGASAWEQLEDRSIRIVVSDWQLPGISGLELCRRIRERGGDYVSFILVTQLPPSDENVDAAIVAGVDEFLAKPINLSELKLRLHAAARTLNLTAQVQQLESFIPICAHCKNVRDDKNYWQQIESYINTRLGTRFSHGICPACYEKVMLPQLQELDRSSIPPSVRRTPPAQP
jgi:sigma-B regulation protein RsbU (phosphoserine phosphatase)